MIRLLYGVGAMLSILMMGAVAAQNSKAEGFGAGLGGPGGSHRGNRRDEMLARATRVIGVAWAVTFLLLSWLVNNAPDVSGE